MFKHDATGPTASGRLPATHAVTNECVQFAWRAVAELCDEHGPALSQAYGNFDRVVGLGWLLGDIALGLLISKADAHKIGRKGGKLAPGLQAQFDAPARRLGKRKTAASDEEWAAAAKEEADVRREPVKLLFSDACLPALPDAPTPAPSAALKRQRVEQPEMPPPPPPPPAAPARCGERLKLLKALRAAESLVADARCVFAAAKRDHDKARAAWDYVRETQHRELPHRAAQFSTDEQWKKFDLMCNNELDAARVRLNAAARAIHPPEDALWCAEDEAEEARFELDQYEKARARKEKVDLEMAESDERCRRHDKVMSILLGSQEPDVWEFPQLHRLWKLQCE